jgi:outer membrane protein TolC
MRGDADVMHTMRSGRHQRAGIVAVYLAVFVASPRPGAAQSPAPPQRDFQGSVAAGEPTGTMLALSLKDTFDRALRYNLGLLESDQDVRAARAMRLRGLSSLLPDISGQVSSSRQQINLAASGFNFTFPGVNIPTVVGPFNVADARVYATQQILNWSDIKHWQSTAESERASQYSNKNDREMVILATGYAYLRVISDHANVDSTRAQLTTAQALHDRSVDQNRAGVIASIDVLRARVELQTQQQRLIAAENQLAIDKLTLARTIGLPKGQQFQITDLVTYAPLDDITLAQALERAATTRADYLGAKATVRAAELARQSAAAGNYPSLAADANYGAIGSPDFGAAHGTFSVAVTLNVPIFRGTRVLADTLDADSLLRQRKAELADLDGKIDQQVRTAFFNLRSSSDLVTVARSNIDLANQTLVQAQGRFNAGVATNLDVVQAQESVASANQSHIASLYAYNVAKISLAQAIGVAEQSALEYLGAK